MKVSPLSNGYDAARYLEAADEALRAAGVLNAEEMHRQAASSAYFCMHRSALALLSLKERYPRTHRGTIQELRRHFVEPGAIDEEFAVWIAQALQVRINADYRLEPAPDVHIVEAMIEQAETFLDVASAIIEEAD